MDANIGSTKGTQQEDSKDESTNEETAFQEQLLEKTNKVRH